GDERCERSSTRQPRELPDARGTHALTLGRKWASVVPRSSDSKSPRESGRRGSNPRPTAWEAVALPTELRPRAEKSYRTGTDASQVSWHSRSSSDGDLPSPPRLARLAPDSGPARGHNRNGIRTDWKSVPWCSELAEEEEMAIQTTSLEEIAQALVAPGKGILAADESSGTIKKRFDSIGVESTEESRRAYRDLLFTTEGAEGFISGVILYDETIRQSSANGTPFPELLESKGIVPGIKVD